MALFPFLSLPLPHWAVKLQRLGTGVLKHHDVSSIMGPLGLAKISCKANKQSREKVSELMSRLWLATPALEAIVACVPSFLNVTLT